MIMCRYCEFKIKGGIDGTGEGPGILDMGLSNSYVHGRICYSNHEWRIVISALGNSAQSLPLNACPFCYRQLVVSDKQIYDEKQLAIKRLYGSLLDNIKKFDVNDLIEVVDRQIEVGDWQEEARTAFHWVYGLVDEELPPYSGEKEEITWRWIEHNGNKTMLKLDFGQGTDASLIPWSEELEKEFPIKNLVTIDAINDSIHATLKKYNWL